VIGLGAELRLFGDEISPALNPYLGFQQYWLTSSPGAGSGSSVYFGARHYFTDILALDGNFGAALWQEDTKEDEDLKEWIARIGLTFAFGRIRESQTVRGVIRTINGNPKAGAQYVPGLERIGSGEMDRYDEEVRLFALDSIGQLKCPPCPKQVGNVTDLKFYKIDLDFALAMDPLNRMAGLLDSTDGGDDEVFIAVVFSRNDTFVDSLTPKNTFFHFVDLDRCQYFGYRWDLNRQRQREHRASEEWHLGDAVDESGFTYMGNYDEFVKPVSWLDRETIMRFINGKSVEQEILRLLDEKHKSNPIVVDSVGLPAHKPVDISRYRIGYVSFPQSTLNKLKDYLRVSDMGAAVLVGSPRDTGSAAIADASFSNHVKLEDVFTADDSLDGFDYCSALLSAEHCEKLDALAEYLLSHPRKKIELIGYADGTVPSDDCRRLYPDPEQTDLARARAEAVRHYLVEDKDVSGNRIVQTEGRGVRQPAQERQPRDRCVVVRFLE
jgi:outer membrane protein OmpA-like peptidoglycan-associated protein